MFTNELIKYRYHVVPTPVRYQYCHMIGIAELVIIAITFSLKLPSSEGAYLKFCQKLPEMAYITEIFFNYE